MHGVVKEPLPRRRMRPVLGVGSKALFGAALAVVAASASGANLSDVYAQAVANDPVLAGARALHQSRLEGVPLARAGLMPRVGANASASWSTVSTDGTDLNQGSSNFGRPVSGPRSGTAQLGRRRQPSGAGPAGLVQLPQRQGARQAGRLGPRSDHPRL